MPPAAVLPASSQPCSQTVCPCPSQCFLDCGFAKGMLLPGSFGKCLVGDEPPMPCWWLWGRRVGFWGVTGWNLCSFFFSTCLVLLVLYEHRSFAILGQFSLGGGSSLIFVDCKTIWEQHLVSQRSSPISGREGQTVLVSKYFSPCVSQISHHQRGTFPFCQWSCWVYSCWGMRALNLPTTPSIVCIKIN